MSNERKLNTNNLKYLVKLFSLIKSRYRTKFFLVIFFVILACITNLLSSFATSILIDNFITPNIGNSNPDFTYLYIFLAVFGSIYLVGVLSIYIYTRLLVTITQGTLNHLRMKLFTHMQKLPISFFDWNTNGHIMSYYTNDIDAIRQVISMTLPQFITTIVAVIGTMFFMIYYSWILTLVFLVILTCTFLTIKYIGSRSTKNFIQKQKELAVLNGYAEEMFEGSKVIKVFSHEKVAIDEFKKINEKLLQVDKKANTYASIIMPIMNNIGFVSYAVLALVGGFMVSSNINYGIIPLTAGTLISFIMFSRQVINPLSNVSYQVNIIATAMAGSKRIFDVMELEQEQDKGYVTLVKGYYENDIFIENENDNRSYWYWKHPHTDGSLTYHEVKGDVRLFNVDFSYKPEKKILKNVSLYAKEGQKIAFVGATGAGKTTITNLINRFYDIEDGKIRFDNININKIKKKDLRKCLGVVLQDTNLFTGSIKDNIKYGCKDATMDDVIRVAKLANAHDFIMKLPQGYDTIITNNGDILSQGEKQLLSIARVAILNPPVLILDEATSSIDTRTEKIIQNAMDKLMSGRTVFVIAHRLSTVINSNAIMVLKNGTIIERGDHQELLDQKGEYYQLYTGSFSDD